MLNVVITGGTGLVGKRLAQLLISQNYNVTVLTRSKTLKSNSITYSYWDVENKLIDIDVITKADYIIHLAGEGIANKRWTKKQQIKILESRVKPLEFIYEILSTYHHQLKSLISASGVGYYGARTLPQIFSEEDKPYPDFLGDTCEKWEYVVFKFNDLNIRTVVLRTGLVLSKDGGVLAKMITPFKYNFGACLGLGKQYLPWIHVDDLCNMYLFAIQNNSIKGIYNACVADDTTNAIFTYKLAKQLKSRILFPNVPAFLFKLFLGKMSGIILEGSRVSNAKIKQEGFKFNYEELDEALLNLIG